MILAAGKGTRMRSELPKVLHPMAGKPMLYYPIAAALDAGAKHVVVVIGQNAERIEATLEHYFQDRVTIAIQTEQRGTGDAVACGLNKIKDSSGWLAIAYGDMPLLQASVFHTLSGLDPKSAAGLRMITTMVENPTGYGRIIRNVSSEIGEVKEQRDCSQAEQAICEINPGIYFVDLAFIRKAITMLNPNNAQQELLLTDIVKLAAEQVGVHGVPWDAQDLYGVNDRRDLAAAEKRMRRRIAEQHALDGVTIHDLDTVYVDHDVRLGPDVTLQNGVTLRGTCVIEKGAYIDVGCVLQDTHVQENAYLKPYTVVTQSIVGPEAQLGPFAHVRPRSNIGRRAQIGNFVETKHTQLGEGSKANHLAYLGDGDIGEGVNIGAGTIFCNYDGVQKHRTVLGDNVFVGSDSQLVAPIKIGENAYIATGTTVTTDVPDDALAIGRSRQENKKGYADILRKRLRARKRSAS